MSSSSRYLLRRYLIGEATDEEMRKIEERSRVDEDYREWVRAGEPEVIADYISGDLTDAERWSFEKYFLISEERRERLRLAELLYERARTGAARFPCAGDPFYMYFLGDVTPDEKLKIEERLDADDDYKRDFEIAQHELIASYTLEPSTGAERKRFQPYFFGANERIEKLRFAEEVYSYYSCDDQIEATEVASVTRLDRLRRLLFNPVNISITRPMATKSTEMGHLIISE